MDNVPVFELLMPPARQQQVRCGLDLVQLAAASLLLLWMTHLHLPLQQNLAFVIAASPDDRG